MIEGLVFAGAKALLVYGQRGDSIFGEELLFFEFGDVQLFVASQKRPPLESLDLLF